MNSPKGEETIFVEALRLPPQERSAFLAQATAGNPQLRQEVESLLRSHGAGEFLEQGASLQFRQAIQLSVPVTEKAGDRIGRYKLLQQIGEGGCGVVYMAEQEEPVRRRVALKIIKLGMDTKSVIARFEAERQALAMMDHPNIAKVLDAGATETGRPYFVMELVRGLKITEYCDEARLSTHARLDLFIQVCQAIQHAHQKGIIHRDIKPSNILVSANDGVLVPKVIDFGIAKATNGQALTDKTLFTAFEQFIGTPAYMSPEQAVITNVDIDTRSDIYALGVLLYELLTGKTPFDARELFAIGLDEMRRTIREQEPPRPSARLTTLPGQELSTAAHRRGLDAPKLVSELRGDLDWIVMKALEKDRSRRYETASGLAADIQRHLNNEPVAACPPSKLYQLQKLARRHKVALSAAAAVAAALFIGLGISVWMFTRERTAVREQTRLREQAQAEIVKSRQVAQFLRDMLKGVRPRIALGRDTTILEEILDQTAERIAKELTGQPAVEADLQYTLGITYRDLGRYEKSERMLVQALTLRRKLFGDEHLDVAEPIADLGYLRYKQQRYAEAEALLTEALAMERKLLTNDDRRIASLLQNLAVTLDAESKTNQTESAYLQALAIHRRLGDEVGATYPLTDLAIHLAHKQHNFERAETMLREVVAVRRKRLSANHPDIASSLEDLGRLLILRDRYNEAEEVIQEALALQKQVLGNEHPEVAKTLHDLARIYESRNPKSWSIAEDLNRQALAIRRKVLPHDHRELAWSLQYVARALGEQQRWVEAEPFAQEALAIRQKMLGHEHNETIDSKIALAALMAEQGKLTEAAPLYSDVLCFRRKALGDDHKEVAQVLELLNRIAWVLATSADASKRNGPVAVGVGEHVVTASRAKPEYLDTLAAAYAEVGHFEKAITNQIEAIATMEPGEIRKDCESRLKLYRMNLPYREP